MKARRLVLASSVALILPSLARAATHVRVEFTAAGECAIATSGAGAAGTLKYMRRTSEWRCAVPGIRQGEAVHLEVVLPPGMRASAGTFPQLAWTEAGGRAVGTANLPSAPAFVRVPAPGGERYAAYWLLDLFAVVTTAAAAAWSLVKGRAA